MSYNNVGVIPMKEEFEKISTYKNAKLPVADRLKETELRYAVEKCWRDYEDGNYCFEKLYNMPVKQNKKTRMTKMYERFSCEEILCAFLKRILDKKFKIKYANRNRYVLSLFNILPAVIQMQDFCIIKFDFKDYFNSVSSVYVFEKYINNSNLERNDIALLKDYVYKTKYAYAGLSVSNILCEIIAKEFDDLLISKLTNNGLIFYRRYIDDGIIILNNYVEKSKINKILQDTVVETFKDDKVNSIIKCKVKLNESKFKLIQRRDMDVAKLYKVDFLGYEFTLKYANDKIDIRYGITDIKRDKYQKKINSLVKAYVDKKVTLELLRHQIKAFSSRVVYPTTHYNRTIWKTKGFLSNYIELSNHLDSIDEKTEDFLRNAIFDAFGTQGVDYPYFISTKNNTSIYNLYNNMKSRHTLLFSEQIGFDKKTLTSMCKQINLKVASKDSYEFLVSKYLIATKVGH